MKRNGRSLTLSPRYNTSAKEYQATVSYDDGTTTLVGNAEKSGLNADLFDYKHQMNVDHGALMPPADEIRPQPVPSRAEIRANAATDYPDATPEDVNVWVKAMAEPDFTKASNIIKRQIAKDGGNTQLDIMLTDLHGERQMFGMDAARPPYSPTVDPDAVDGVIAQATRDSGLTPVRQDVWALQAATQEPYLSDAIASLQADFTQRYGKMGAGATQDAIDGWRRYDALVSALREDFPKIHPLQNPNASLGPVLDGDGWKVGQLDQQGGALRSLADRVYPTREEAQAAADRMMATRNVSSSRATPGADDFRRADSADDAPSSP